MFLYFSHAHFPVTTLGFGRRVGIWLQGCSLGCPGCIAPHTWERTAAHRVELSALMQRLAPFFAAAEGVTISGGEPFEQPRALAALLDAARQACPQGDLLAYSGHPAAWLKRRYPGIVARLDVLIPEPFVAAAPSVHPLTGSANQSVLLLSPLARQRYSAVTGDAAPRIMNIAPGADRVRFAGLPRRGEFDRVAAAAAQPKHLSTSR